MPIKDAFRVRYGKNGEETVGDALDDLYENHTWDGEVDYFTELPSAVSNDGKTYYVKKYTLLSPIRLTGLYYSDGANWKRRSDKVVYSLTAFTGTNKLVKTADTKGQVIETPLEIDANDDLDLKDNNLQNVGYVQFDTSVALPSPVEGKLAWSDTEKTLNLGMAGGNVNQQIGLELFVRAKAIGSAIPNGSVVYVSGASGNNPEMTLARADLKTTSDCVIGIATETVLENALGYFATFGKVREIDTDGISAGTVIYLSDSVAGGFTATPPSAPSRVIKVGIVVRESVDEGIVEVCIQFFEVSLDREIQKEPTGFSDPEDVVVTGDGSARTITLTGTVEAYWHGLHVPALVSGWESDPHADDTNPYYLIYDGSTFQWVSVANFKFYYLLIAFSFYASGTNERVYSRECHGLMPWQSHAEFHEIIGTYRQSGGDLADYVLSSTTATDRRPSISSTSIVDEDLKTINPLLASDSNYTQSWLSGAGADSNFATTTVDIVPLSGNQPYWNEFTGGAWQQTLMSNNYYQSIWLIAIPVASETTSQKYRYVFIQGQNESLSLSGQTNLNPADLNLGDLVEYAPEFIFFKQIIIRYTASNWVIQQVVNLTGTLNAQVGSPAGNFLTAVTTDATLTGEGTVSTPLGVALNNANSWTATQTFSEVDVDNINLNGSTIAIGGQTTANISINPPASANPSFDIFCTALNNLNISFDAYWNSGTSTWKSNFASGNYLIRKIQNQLRFSSDSLILVNNDITWNDDWILRTDGNITHPRQCSFSAYLSSTQSNVTGDGTVYTIIYDTEEYDVGSDYNNSTGVFTAPVSGNYLFSANILCSDLDADPAYSALNFILNLSNGNKRLLQMTNVAGLGGTMAQTSSQKIYMDTGDTAYLTINVGGGTKSVDVVTASGNRNNFSGTLLH